ncbi:MAG: bacillithiol system redox-active protein YtxJ [Pyrinomonadaceae bacterium]
MPANFIKVDSIERLDDLLQESYERAVVLFKHSNTCGMSSYVIEQTAVIDGDIHLIVVQEHRSVSNAAAERIGHRHQSPQAFVIKDGKAVYHATHYGIDPVEIENRLAGLNE